MRCFSRRTAVAQFAHVGVIPLRQRQDELVKRRLFAHLNHLIVGGVQLGQTDVVLDLSWNRWVSCSTKLSMARRSAVFTSCTGRPDTYLPAVRVPEAHQQFQRVDFPAPLRPVMPIT